MGTERLAALLALLALLAVEPRPRVTLEMVGHAQEYLIGYVSLDEGDYRITDGDTFHTFRLEQVRYLTVEVQS